LVFEIATSRPLIDLHSQSIDAHSHLLGNVKLSGEPTALAEPSQRPVHPHIEGRIYALESQIDPLAPPFLRNVKIPPIRPRWVLHGYPWRIHWERILDIRVVWMAISLTLPTRGYLDLIPRAYIRVLIEEAFRCQLGASCKVKPPHTV
jgi:hypothetical protein